MTDTPWWHPDRHADRRPMLMARNRIQAGLRAWFAERDFTEVDPAALAVSPGNEAHLHAFATEMIGNDSHPRRMYLHTSPEFAMKKLLAAGETRIHAFARVWRNRERGTRHSPEFTMLEWYRADEDYAVIMDDCVEILRLAVNNGGPAVLRYRAAVCDPFAEPQRLSVAQAFTLHAGIDLISSIAPDGTTDTETLAASLRSVGLRVAEDDTWSDMLAAVLVQRVEPHLGIGQITILDRYPAAEAALARRVPGDPRIAERFEVYACGVELANGFGELTDAAEQRHRFAAEMDEKERVYGDRYPLDEDFLAALAFMPPASGVALGFDRLVMLATGAARIDDVLWTPVAG